MFPFGNCCQSYKERLRSLKSEIRRLLNRRRSVSERVLMILRDYKNDRRWNDWLAKRFENKETISLVVDLLPCRVHEGSQEWLRQDIIEQTARRFRNKLNDHYFGHAARRYGKSLEMTIHLHTDPHKHFHIVSEKPNDELLIKFRSVVENICLKDGWLKPFPYFDETERVRAAQAYNGKNGNETLVLF